MKIRIKFRKWGAMRYVGHLDMMRYFQKVMRRAGIDIKYSEGFSPHQIMSFAYPLGVGMTSDAEYFDIEVGESGSSENAIAAMNEVMVDGVQVLSYVRLPDDAKPAMSIVAAADYAVIPKDGFSSNFSAEEWQNNIHKFYAEPENIFFEKNTKNGIRTLDLKPLIYRLEITPDMAFNMSISSGSVDNIKPELVMSALFDSCGKVFEKEKFHVHRREVYARSEDGKLIPLSELGSEIV